MKINKEKALAWIKNVSAALPEIDRISQVATSDILVIGAGVFDIYHDFDWTPALKRKTGDLDLSVGLVSGESDYDVIKSALIKAGYRNEQHPYRFFTPKTIPGALTYIDLLAHPSAEESETTARSVMGVGPEFSFKGMAFATTERIPISTHIFCPNPIGMVMLKMTSYNDDPNRRIKDLADIAELAWGLVEKGTHFQMSDLWGKIKGLPEAKRVKKTLEELGGGKSTTWDLDNAQRELLSRGFSQNDIDTVVPEHIKEWASFLE